MQKEHKFFERFLDNDLDKLKGFLLKTYDEMQNQQIKGITPVDPKSDKWVESQSLSTIKWREYNVFQFYNAELHNIYTNLSELVHEACDYYEIDFKKQKFFAQGWFNINQTGAGKLDYHDHGTPGAPNFHGYYSVNAEPSITHYKLFNDPSRIVDNVNKNNRLIVSEVGHPHAMGDWDWSGPRITIAYDVQPLEVLLAAGKTIPEQHWIPMI